VPQQNTTQHNWLSKEPLSFHFIYIYIYIYVCVCVCVCVCITVLLHINHSCLLVFIKTCWNYCTLFYNSFHPCPCPILCLPLPCDLQNVY
jgi:hypothetical protein